MAFSRVQSVFTYKTAAGGQDYIYDILVDAQSAVSVRNIRGPRGLIQDSLTGLPSAVVLDINEALELVALLVAETEAASGTVQFTGQTSRPVVIAGGVLNNTNYRVLYNTPDGTYLRTEGKTTTGFTATAPAAYGTVNAPKVVAYSVLVSTAQDSAFSGVLSFVAADAGVKAVVFPSALPSANYRVHLSPSDFFAAKVVSKTKTGFSVVLGYSVPVGPGVTVGFDVFV